MVYSGLLFSGLGQLVTFIKLCSEPNITTLLPFDFKKILRNDGQKFLPHDNGSGWAPDN